LLYRSTCCDGGHYTLSADDTPRISAAVLDDLIKSTFDGTTFDRKKLLQETAQLFDLGVGKGYGKQLAKVGFNSPDWRMLTELHYNVGVFAAFKNHNNIQDLVKLLKTKDGTLRNWNDFKTEARKLNATYNQRWLKTEYDQAVTSARAARKWQDIERTKSIYPNLEYRAIGDDRTRQLHRNWHGMILPVGHTFWNTHYPPNDYGCRCTVRRTDRAVDEKGYDSKNMPDLSPQWNQNVGKTGKVFDSDHPYFKTQGFKDVAKFANKALLGMQAVNIRQHLRATAIGKTYTSPAGKVGVTGGSIKKLLRNNYHSNSLLWDLKGLLKNAVLVKSAANTKAANTMVVRYHYLKARAGDGKEYYLNVRELKTGELILYAITYGMK